MSRYSQPVDRSKRVNEPAARVCSYCKLLKPIEEFYFRRRVVDPNGKLADRLSYCVDCAKKDNTRKARRSRFCRDSTEGLLSELDRLKLLYHEIITELRNRGVSDGDLPTFRPVD